MEDKAMRLDKLIATKILICNVQKAKDSELNVLFRRAEKRAERLILDIKLNLRCNSEKLKNLFKNKATVQKIFKKILQ